MKHVKSMGIGIFIMLFSLVALTACGGEAPAPPTATSPPPTATPAPPTATTAPTSTSGSGPAGGTVTTSEEADALIEAVEETADLRSYHYTMDVDATDDEQRAEVEGDYVAPNKGYVKGTIGGATIEQLISGDTVFVKDASGQWVEREDSSSSADPMQLVDPNTFASDANPIEGLNSLLEAGTNWRDRGEETINGARVRHYSFDLDSAAMMGEDAAEVEKQMGGEIPSIGDGEIWVDTSTKYVHRISVNMDFAFLIRLLAETMTAAFGGTPTPGGPTPTAVPAADFKITMNVTKHNDPSIKIPDAPAVSPESDDPTPTSGSSAPAPTTAGSSTSATQVLNMGQTGEIDGLKITLHSVRRTEKGMLNNAEEGKEYVIAKLTFENTTAEEKPISSLLQFSIKDDAGTEYDIDLLSDVKTTPDGTVPANGKLEGESGFQVPKTAKGLVFTYTPLLTSDTVQFTLDK